RPRSFGRSAQSAAARQPEHLLQTARPADGQDSRGIDTAYPAATRRRIAGEEPAHRGGDRVYGGVQQSQIFYPVFQVGLRLYTVGVPRGEKDGEGVTAFWLIFSRVLPRLLRRLPRSFALVQANEPAGYPDGKAYQQFGHGPGASGGHREEAVRVRHEVILVPRRWGIGFFGHGSIRLFLYDTYFAVPFLDDLADVIEAVFVGLPAHTFHQIFVTHIGRAHVSPVRLPIRVERGPRPLSSAPRYRYKRLPAPAPGGSGRRQSMPASSG